MILMRLMTRRVKNDGEGGKEEEREQSGDKDPVREETTKSGSDAAPASTEGHRHLYRYTFTFTGHSCIQIGKFWFRFVGEVLACPRDR